MNDSVEQSGNFHMGIFYVTTFTQGGRNFFRDDLQARHLKKFLFNFSYSNNTKQTWLKLQTTFMFMLNPVTNAGILDLKTMVEY